LQAWQFKPVMVEMLSVQVCSESTGHAEPVQMTCDPQQVEYGKLADLLNSRHDSTTRNRSGNDVGTQYRSGIYYHTDEQKQVPSLFLSADLGSAQTLASQHVLQFCEIWCI